VVMASCITIDPGLRLVKPKGTVVCEVPEPFASVRMSSQISLRGLALGIGRWHLGCRGGINVVLVMRSCVFAGGSTGVGVRVDGVAPVGQQPGDHHRRHGVGGVPV
jgi:hypothetical protein